MIGIPQFIENLPPLPVLEQVGGGRIIEEREQKLCDADELLDEIERVQQDNFPDLPLFEFVRMFFQHPKELCVTGITDAWTNWLIGMEAACKRYGALPFAGGWLDQPMWVIDIFEEIASTQILFERKRTAELNKKRE